MVFLDPHYPNIVLSFTYRGVRLELDQGEEQGITVYTVWASHAHGYAVAVPQVFSRTEAIHRAKRWVDGRLGH